MRTGTWGADLPDLAQRLDPVHVRHADVQEDDVKGLFPHGLHGLRAVGGLRHRVPLRAQDSLEHDPVALFIVHDQYLGFFSHSRSFSRPGGRSRPRRHPPEG